MEDVQRTCIVAALKNILKRGRPTSVMMSVDGPT